MITRPRWTGPALAALLAIGCAAPGPAATAEPRVEAQPATEAVPATAPAAVLSAPVLATPEQRAQNVVASRLAGDWVEDASWTERLGLEPSLEPWRFSFESELGALDDFPDEYREHLAGRVIFDAGTMTVTRSAGDPTEHPFLLTSLHGNPHVLYLRVARGPDGPRLDGESFNVMLGRGKGHDGDVLLVGGDFNNQPFRAYRRAGPDD